MVTEADPKLQQIIDRLGKQGIKNLAVGMQLMSRCDPSPGTPGKCKVSGSVDLKDNSQELFVDAIFSQLQGAQVLRCSTGTSKSGPRERLLRPGLSRVLPLKSMSTLYPESTTCFRPRQMGTITRFL